MILLHVAFGGQRNGPFGYLRLHAEWFACHGIAALIYDRRDCLVGTDGEGESSLYDLADDAVAGYRVLAGHPAIDPRHIGFWGISQGGWLAPLAAMRCGTAAFVMTVSGPGVSPAEQGLFQIEHVLRDDGYPDHEVAEAVSLMRRTYEVAFSGVGWPELAASIQAARTRDWFPHVMAPSSPDDLLGYRRFPHDFDPVPVWEQITCPALAMFGERDMDVPVDESVARIERALRGGGNRDYTINVFPGADHMIMLSETGGFKRLPLTTGFAPAYCTTMTDWLMQRVTAHRAGTGSHRTQTTAEDSGQL